MASNIYNRRNAGFNNNAILQITNNTDYNPEQSFPPTGALQVAGGASIQKNLYVGDSLYCETIEVANITTSGDINVHNINATGVISGYSNIQNLTVTGATHVAGLTASGVVNVTSLTASGVVNVGSLTASNGLTASNITTTSAKVGALTTTGKLSAQETITARNGIACNQSFTFNTAGNEQGTPYVMMTQGQVSVAGDLSVDGTMTVYGQLKPDHLSTNDAIIHSTNDVSFDADGILDYQTTPFTTKGGAGISKSLYVGGDIILHGQIVTSAEQGIKITPGSAEAPFILGDAVADTFTCSQGISITATDDVSYDINGEMVSASLTTTGGVGITKNVYVGGDTTVKGVINAPTGQGSVKITSAIVQDTTDMTLTGGTIAAPLLTAGGAGIKKSLYVGGDLIVNGKIKSTTPEGDPVELKVALQPGTIEIPLNVGVVLAAGVVVPEGTMTIGSTGSGVVMNTAGDLTMTGKLTNLGDTSLTTCSVISTSNPSTNIGFTAFTNTGALHVKGGVSIIKDCDVLGNTNVNKITVNSDQKNVIDGMGIPSQSAILCRNGDIASGNNIYATNSIYSDSVFAGSDLSVGSTEGGSVTFLCPATVQNITSSGSLTCKNLTVNGVNTNEGGITCKNLAVKGSVTIEDFDTTNYITNGYFASPTISGNSAIYDFTSIQCTQFFWTVTSTDFVYLLHGDSNGWDYPSVSGLADQYVGLQMGCAIEQTVTIPTSGYYVLRFSYAYRASSIYPPNPIKIYYANVLLETLPSVATTRTAWTSYTKHIFCNAGSQILKFVGVDTSGILASDTNTAITNISLVYGGTISSSDGTISCQGVVCDALTSGSITCSSLTLLSQASAQVFAAPTLTSGIPAFRTLKCADISDLNTILQQLFVQVTTPNTTNILSNGTLASPPLSTNTYQPYSSLTTLQKTQLVWTTTNGSPVTFINGTTAYGYPSVTGQTFTQYMSLQSGGEFEQRFTIPSSDNYVLSFSYGYRTTVSFPPNAAQIYLGNTYLDTLPNASSTQGWFSYKKTIYVPAGPHLLKFQAANTAGIDTDTAIANISLVLTNAWWP